MTVKIRKADPNNILKGLQINPKAHSIVLHCSASDNPDYGPKEIQRDHIRRFSDIGYHFIIHQGDIYICRPMTRIPAAQLGFNTDTYTICTTGLTHFEDRDFYKLELLCQQLQEKHNGLILSKRLRIMGHRDVAVSPKDCPVFDYAEVLNLLYEGDDVVTARWAVKDQDGNRIRKQKRFKVPKYYLRAKEVRETRTGKGIITSSTGTGLTIAKVAVAGAKSASVASVATKAGVGLATAGGVAEAAESVDLSGVATTVDAVTTIASGVADFISIVGSLLSGVLSFLPFWFTFGLIVLGLSIAYYARLDDIKKGDIKRNITNYVDELF